MSSSGAPRGGQKSRASGMAAIRNLGIMAHIDAGKTTTTERVLFLAGATSRAGNVDDGSTVTDWMPEEQERGISIVAAATTLAWLGHTLNLIDTPGHVDFTMEVERSLRVLDGAVAVFDAVAGVEPQSETVWRQADKYGVPRIALVNKCDRVAVDSHDDFAEQLIAAMRTRLGARAAAVQVPWFVDGKLFGVVDVVAGHALSWEIGTGIAKKVKLTKLPEEVQAAASLARDVLVEALADTDETVLAAFVAGSEISSSVLVAAIRRATLAGALVPVLFGAAKHNLGVRELLDAVVAFLPAPSDLIIRGHAVTDDADVLPTLSREASVDAPTAALAFKLESHGAPQSNDHEQLTYLRVYSGVVRVGDTLLNPTKQTLEQVERLVRMHANRREDISELPAGMIGAIVGTSQSVSTGDTLCDPTAPIVLARIHIPEPVVGLVVVPETNDDHARMTVALERLAVQDPSFRIRVDAETGQTVIAGMGELHLEILLDRLRREFGVNARAGRPMVAYRETVRQRGEADERYVRSEPGRYGHVRLVVEPSKRGSGNSITASASTAEIPREYVPAVTAGVTDAMERGIALGYPMTDVHVDVVGGSYHPVDSSASAFAVAGSMALVSAASKAGAVVLEPVMAVEVVTPDECVGDVLGDLHARRGKIAGIATRPGVQTVACYVPLASMFGYASDLRSRTRGRATYSMEFQLYAEVPSSIREELGRGRI